MKSPYSNASAVAGPLVLTAAFIVAWWLSNEQDLTQWGWAGTAILMVAFCACLGIAMNGRPAGLIIDNRNRVSLSKLQATVWTILVMSALTVAVFKRIHLALGHPANVIDSASVTIPSQVLAAMGLSATSLVATPVILSLKKVQLAAPDQAARTATALGDSGGVASVGAVYARADPDKARWMDIFRGDEVSNAATPDLGKVQQFLVTVVVVVVYAATLWTLFGSATKSGDLAKLPDFGDQMAWLLGISHAGYLAYKAAPHGPGSTTAPAVVSGSAGHPAG